MKTLEQQLEEVKAKEKTINDELHKLYDEHKRLANEIEVPKLIEKYEGKYFTTEQDNGIFIKAGKNYHYYNITKILDSEKFLCNSFHLSNYSDLDRTKINDEFIIKVDSIYNKHDISYLIEVTKEEYYSKLKEVGKTLI